MNRGLSRWLEVRSLWTGRTADGKPRPTGDAASAAAASGDKTQLPHAMSTRPPRNCLSGGGSSSSDEFVMASSDSDTEEDGERDINQRVPMILAAREAYTPFSPPVKLSDMVSSSSSS